MAIHVLELREEVPGKRLRLENIDKAIPPFKSRLGCLAICAAVLAVTDGIYFFVYRDLVNFLAMTAFLAFITVVAAAVLLIRKPRLLELDVNRADGIHYSRGLPGNLPSEEKSIDCSSVNFMIVKLSQSNPRKAPSNAPFQLKLCGIEHQLLLDARVRVTGVNSDAELLDFVARTGWAIGLRYYRVVLRDPRRFEVHITRDPQDGSARIPQFEQPADYSSGFVASELQLPEEIVERFDPSVPLPGGGGVVQWIPGHMILIAKRQRAVRWIGAFVCAAFMLGCAWARLNLNQTHWFGEYGLLLIITAIAFAIASYLLFRSLLFACEVDLTARLARVRFGLRRRTIALSNAEKVILRRVILKRKDRKWSYYGYRLELKMLDGERFTLIPEPAGRLGQFDEHFDVMYPFTVALASELRLPHLYDDSLQTVDP